MKMTASRSKLLANRLQEVLLDGRWIANTNFKQQLHNLTWQEATQQFQNRNSIAALYFHITYYLVGILNVYKGGKLEIKDEFSFDMPPINSEADWENLCHSFLINAAEFVSHIEKMPDQKLDEIFVHEEYGTYLRNIEGVIEHSSYHLGQISLLKKCLKEQHQ